jgi:hypothetical protein
LVYSTPDSLNTAGLKGRLYFTVLLSVPIAQGVKLTLVRPLSAQQRDRRSVPLKASRLLFSWMDPVYYRSDDGVAGMRNEGMLLEDYLQQLEEEAERKGKG